MYFGFKNITIKYGKRTVIDDVVMDFSKGEITTIIGPNGCGKTSLLKTVSYAVTPESGQVLFCDKPIGAYKPKELAQKIAYLPQIHFSPSDIDIKTLVSYGRYPYKKFGKSLTREDEVIIDRAIELTGLSHLKHSLLNNLSGGEKQRAWIAMTICQEPEILILDEPITYLDVGYQVEVLELIKKLKEELNITIVMVLHDINLAARYSDKIYALRNKNIYAYGSSAEVITRDILEDMFNIDSQVLGDKVNDCPFIIPQKSHKERI